MSTLPDRPMRADARRNRERIIDAARRVFGEAGLGAQMDDVAQQADVGVGTVYRHFPDKEALMGELIYEKFALMLRHAEEATAAPGEPFEVFAALLRRNAGAMARDAATQYALMSAGEHAWEQAAAPRDALKALTSQLIQRAQAAGTMRADVTVEDVPPMMCGLCAVMSNAGVGFDWQRHLDLLLDAWRAR